MDTFDLLIAAVLAIPVLAVISLIVAMSARKRLKQLELRIAGLEWKLAALGDQAPPAAPVTATRTGDFGMASSWTTNPDDSSQRSVPPNSGPYRRSTMAEANSEVLTSVAPSIWRAKS